MALKARWELLLAQAPLAFVGSSEFEDPKADQLFRLELDPVIEDYKLTASRKKLAHYGDLPAGIFAAPLLNKEQEVHIFRRMNYLLFYANRFLLQNPAYRKTRLLAVEAVLEEAQELRNLIVAANTRLVRTNTHSDDEFSDGIESVMRAIHSFDYSRGFRFGTYTTWAITRNRSRNVGKAQKLASRERGMDDAGLSELARMNQDLCGDLGNNEILSRLLSLLPHLDEREQTILKYRMGLDGVEAETLKEVGVRMGVTKERVRQIESRALSKLRDLLGEDTGF